MEDAGLSMRQVRRRRSAAEKRWIVEQTMVPGASVARCRTAPQRCFAVVVSEVLELAERSISVPSFGCPPGIRTPIERVRVASPTIERGGNTDEAPRTASSLTAFRKCTDSLRTGQTTASSLRHSTGSFALYPSRAITEYFRGFFFSSCICKGLPSLSTSSTFTLRYVPSFLLFVGR